MLDTFYVYKKLLNIFPKSSLYGLNYQYILNADVASISIQLNSKSSLLPLIRIFFKHLCSSVLDLTLQILRPGTQSGPIYCSRFTSCNLTNRPDVNRHFDHYLGQLTFEYGFNVKDCAKIGINDIKCRSIHISFDQLQIVLSNLLKEIVFSRDNFVHFRLQIILASLVLIFKSFRYNAWAQHLKEKLLLSNVKYLFTCYDINPYENIIIQFAKFQSKSIIVITMQHSIPLVFNKNQPTISGLTLKIMTSDKMIVWSACSLSIFSEARSQHTDKFIVYPSCQKPPCLLPNNFDNKPLERVFAVLSHPLWKSSNVEISRLQLSLLLLVISNLR